MSCIITYKGKKYSEEQFKEYFINNKQEFATPIAKNKDVIDSFKRKMEGIDYVFSQSPELASIGSKAQYLQYLSTIFKTSKVKDIVYHKTPFSFEKFEKPIEDRKLNKGNKSDAIFFNYENTGFFRSKEGAKTISVIVNTIKNKQTSEDIPYATGSKQEIKDILKEDFDSITVNKFGGKKELLVFEPEQIHILSSKTDIQGFKDFMSFENSEFSKYDSESTKPEYPYFLNFMVDGVPNINNEEKSLKLALKGLTPEEKISFCNHFGITMTEENGKKC